MSLPVYVATFIMKFVIEEIAFVNVNPDGSEEVRVVRFIDSPYDLNIEDITQLLVNYKLK